MNIIIEPPVNETSVGLLRDVLNAETFSDTCCIGAIKGNQVYLRCPNAKHGVIVDTENLNPQVLQWVIGALRDSVALPV